MAQSYEEDIICMFFMLTKDDVLACANKLGIPEEQVTNNEIESLERRVISVFGNWPDVVRSPLQEAIKCPLKLVCYPSCAWWKDGKCAFPRGDEWET